jgi:protein-S-isoprenylcysteine O-methyltransferase Ste14
MDLPLIGYVIWLAIYKITENAAMAKAGTLRQRPRQDWTFFLIAVPFYGVIIGALLEHLYLETTPTFVNLLLGSLLFAAATFLRTKGHLDLQKGFSMFLERPDSQGLVTTGLYGFIRHPLYLGNLCLFVACPLFMAATFTWIVAGLGIVGVFVRIPIEERFLKAEVEGYTTYMEETWALIPGIY